MAIQAPGHIQSLRAPGQRHFRHLAMARSAANALADVNAVIEIDELGQRVYARPRNRFVVAIAGMHRREHRGVGPDL